MGRGQQKATAQAMQQHQTSINYTESLEVVRCLLRVSIFHVSYLRGLFPDDSFKGCDMKNLDGMHIKMLMPSCDESKRLIDWVERGVYDAIKQGFLKNLFFGISSDPDGTHLLEEYIFSFNYGDEGVSMDLQAKANGQECDVTAEDRKRKAKGGKERPKADLTTVRYQICRLMRMLVQICQTLDKVPSKRYLFMKLTYHDHTPEEYEPPYFVPVDENGVGHFKRQPFSMAVGDVTTEHHGVTLKVKSVLDMCDDLEEEDAGAAGADVQVSAQSASVASEGEGEGAAGKEVGEVEDDGMMEGNGQAAAAAPSPSPMKDPRRRAKADIEALMTEPQQQLGEGTGEEAGEWMEEGEDDGHKDQKKLRHQQHEAAGMARVGSGTDDAQRGGGEEDDEDVTEAPMPQAYYDVQAFIGSCQQVHMRELACRFSTLSEEELGGYVAALLREGAVLQVPGMRNVFKPAAFCANGSGTKTQAEVESLRRAAPAAVPDAASPLGAPKAPKASDDLEEMADRMTGLTMGGAGADNGDCHRGQDTRRARDQAAMSLAGQMQSAQEGEEMTEAPAAGHSSKRGADGLERGGSGGGGGEACEPPVIYIHDSQQSNPARRSNRRKASYVADPIQQGGPAAKKARGATPSAAATEQPLAAAPPAKQAMQAPAPAPPANVAAAAGSTPAPRGGRTGGSSRLKAMRR